MSRDLLLRVTSSRARSHVRFAPGGLASLGTFVRGHSAARRVLLVADARVARLYGAAARRALRAADLDVAEHRVPPGERSKSGLQLERVWRACARAGLGRRDAIVALGGGVTGDLAGFAAATWLRGVNWIGVPTSLLAQVDSSVGGKTGIDLPEGKNLTGAFHQPVAVLIDPRLLATLPPRHWRAGLAEIAKLGIITDRGLFGWLERHADALRIPGAPCAAEAIERAVRIKARIVAADEREREAGPRTRLNFGHTAGHAFEAAAGYRALLHGEAVAVGMRVALALSERVAGLSAREHARAGRLLDALALPRRVRALRLPTVLAAMRRDKKAGERGDVRWVLTPRIGTASVPRVVEAARVRAALFAVGVRT